MARRQRADHSGHDEPLAPTPERELRGEVVRLDKPIKDAQDRISRPFRAIDILAAMERRKAITAEMRLAGEDFRDHFRIAQLDPLHAADMARIPKIGVNSSGPGFHVEAAREWIWRAICASGGLASPGGSCLWHVIGFERSLKEWALVYGWAGRTMSQESASGILVCALGALEAFANGDRKN